MDSREVHHPPAPPPPPPAPSLHHPPQSMFMGPTSAFASNNSSMINPNPTSTINPASRFPFSNLAPPPPSQPKPLDSLNSAGFDGSAHLRYNTDPAAKKKRGRPRKYAPDGNIALQLAPTSPIPSSSVNHGDSVGLGTSSGLTPATDPPAKKSRGRPPGSGKRQLDALGDC